MPELPESYRIEKLTILQLRDQAKEKGLRGFWTLSRDQLVELLYPGSPKQDNQNGNQEEKHDSPHSNNSDEVGKQHV